MSTEKLTEWQVCLPVDFGRGYNYVCNNDNLEFLGFSNKAEDALWEAFCDLEIEKVNIINKDGFKVRFIADVCLAALVVEKLMPLVKQFSSLEHFVQLEKVAKKIPVEKMKSVIAFAKDYHLKSDFSCQNVRSLN